MTEDSGRRGRQKWSAKLRPPSSVLRPPHLRERASRGGQYTVIAASYSQLSILLSALHGPAALGHCFQPHRLICLVTRWRAQNRTRPVQGDRRLPKSVRKPILRQLAAASAASDCNHLGTWGLWRSAAMGLPPVLLLPLAPGWPSRGLVECHGSLCPGFVLISKRRLAWNASSRKQKRTAQPTSVAHAGHVDG